VFFQKRNFNGKFLQKKKEAKSKKIKEKNYFGKTAVNS
jgi:hypothetical protein